MRRSDPTTVGYHLSALYSPVGWLSWERIARSWEAAQGSDDAIRAFKNTILGETWVESGEAPDWQRLLDRKEEWGVSTFKSETYRFLRLERPTPEELAGGALFPPGTLHLPGWIDSEWLKQLVAEQLVTVRNKRGFARLEWQKLRERNEALDCRVYARAAAWILGADRWSDK